MIVGTCSICRGPVELPDSYMSTVPPIPKCRECGSTPKRPYGPIIEMNKPTPDPKPTTNTRSQRNG